MIQQDFSPMSKLEFVNLLRDQKTIYSHWHKLNETFSLIMAISISS